MMLHKLEIRNYGRKWPVSIKYQNLHSFKEGLILLFQSILEMRRIAHLHCSPFFRVKVNAALSSSDIKFLLNQMRKAKLVIVSFFMSLNRGI